MRILLKFLLLSIFIFSCSSTKDYSYFDENTIEISKKDFNKKKKTGGFLEITIDSMSRKLTTREKRGTLNNMPKFIETLEAGLNTKLYTSKPISIIFYPGQDDCNRVLSTRTDMALERFKQLEVGLQQVANIKPLYIYKDAKGLENYEGLLDWKEDPNQFIEHLFFKHHYPCNSFVVISSKGDYISYFGEFPKEFVWEAAQILK